MVEMESASCDSNEVKPKSEYKMGSNVLDCFAKLIAENPRVRYDGGIALLKHLSYQKNEDPTSKELSYSLKRLIRGLGASKAISRTGFYMTLTAFLKLNPDTQINDLLQYMDTGLKPNNSNAKSENADIHLGRILLCGAIIRSQLLSKSEAEDQQKIIGILLESGGKRSYLSFSSTEFLVEFLSQLDVESLKAGVWPMLKEKLGKSWAEQTLDSFYLILIMSEKFPTLVSPEFLKEHLGAENIIDAESIEPLLKILTDIPRIHYSRHPVYKIFCEKLVSTDYLIEFWNGIEDKFARPSRSMEYLALELLNFIVPQVKDKSLLPSLLSPYFVQYMLERFINSQFDRKDPVANSFKTFFNHITTSLDDKELSGKVPMSVIKKLVLYPGDLFVEKITGTKIIQMITLNMNKSGIKKLSKFYRKIATNSFTKIYRGKEEPWTNAERLYAVQMWTKLLGHSAMNSEDDWRLEQLKYVFDLGFCEGTNVGNELSSQFRDIFFRALDHKLPKLDNLRNILTELVNHLNDEIFVEKTKILRKPLEEEAVEAWNKMIDFIKKSEEDFKSKHAVLIFFLMDLCMGLQLFSDAKLAIASINEIHSCSERLLTKKASKKNKKVKAEKKVGEEEEEEPEWVEVIVDLLLSLLSRNNHLLRSLGRCVFPHLCPELTPKSIHQILEVLDPNNVKGPLRHKNDEDSDDDSDSDSENDNSDDKGNETEDQTEDAESSDEDDMEEENEDEDETVTDRLRLAVRQALGDASAQTDDEDIDIDDIDEEEGKRLDESLAAAFKILRENRSNNKKKQGKFAESVTHFRVRAIDFLEIYIDSGPSMALALDMLVPLFALLEHCIKDPHQKPLESRVRTLLKKLSSVKKFKDTVGVDETLLTVLAKLLIEKGEKSTSICQEMGDKLSECCTFLIKCVQQAGLPPTTLVDIYGENLTAFFKKRDCILPAILFKYALQLNWEGNWRLAPLLVDFAFDGSIRSFRRSQALEFLTIFYLNHRMINSEEHKNLRQELEKKLFNNSVNWFKELNESRSGQINGDDKLQNGNTGKEVRQKFVGLLWKLLKAVHFCHIPKVWNWQNIADLMVEYRRKVSLSKDTKTSYNKLARAIGAPIKVTTEEKISTEKSEKASNGVKKTEEENVESEESSSDIEKSEDENTEVVSKKKSRKEIKKRLKTVSKKKDKQKLKKEARELRAIAMSKGLEDIHFSSLQLPNGSSKQKPMEMENGNSDENSEEKQTPIKKPSKKRGLLDNSETPTKSKKKKHTLSA